MNNGDCILISDLYDIYKDDVCSEDTKKFIEEHLKECEHCRIVFSAKKANVSVVSKDKKTIKKIKRKISSKTAFFIYLFISLSLLPSVFISVFFPEIFIPDCFTLDPELNIAYSSIDYSEDDIEDVTDCLKKYIRNESLYDGSVLEEIRVAKAYRYHLTSDYDDIPTNKILIVYCTFRYYTNAQNIWADEDVNITHIFILADINGEWQIEPRLYGEGL